MTGALNDAAPADLEARTEGPVDGIVIGDAHLSAAGLAERVRRAAAGLRALGIGEGDSVALFLRNDFPFFEASLAASAVGAYAVPLNWHNKGDEAGYILKDCGARVLVVHADLLPILEAFVPAGVTVLVAAVPPALQAAFGVTDEAAAVPPGALDWAAWRDTNAPDPTPPLPPRASMIYTSGTTGRPKGVRRLPPTTPEEAAGQMRIRREVMGLREGARALMPGPLYHSAPNGYALAAVRLGGLLLVPPRFDPIQLLEDIQRWRITHLYLVPTMFVRLLKLPEAVRRGYDTRSIEFVIHAAAPCPIDVKRQMIEWWGPVINEFYGSTESSAAFFCTSEEWLRHPGTVGRPIDGAVVRILDDEGRDCPPGVPGEIYKRITYLPDFTYQNDDDKRRGIDVGGLITSGDIGFLNEDGYLFLCDRRRDMIISGGVNIYPAEIEAELTGHPDIADCAVFGIPDAEFGEAVMAVVQPMAGARITGEEIRAWLRQRIAGYKVPKAVELRAELPREDSGKIFKRRLRDPYWQAAGRQI